MRSTHQTGRLACCRSQFIYKETPAASKDIPTKQHRRSSAQASPIDRSASWSMTPASSNPCSDHSYELPLRRNLLLLLDLLDVLRFVAGVLLDRLGVVSCEGAGVELPGGAAAAAERFLEATPPLWAPGSPPVTRTTLSSRTAARYRRRRRADENSKLQGAEAGGEGAEDAVCAICLAGLEDAGGGGECETTVAELGGCAHAFHAACIDAWAGAAEAATCPLCRAHITMLPTAAWVNDGRQSLCHACPGDD